jgi:hypothetical protein
MLHRISRWGLWISTLVVLLVTAIQGISGHWVAFFLIWPGPGGPVFGHTALQIVAKLPSYHKMAGFAIGGISVLVLFFAYTSKSSIYVRVFAVLGIVMTALAATGGILYVHSGLQNRWALGQMADAFVGVFGAYFIQLFFMNRTPRFPWSRAKSG